MLTEEEKNQASGNRTCRTFSRSISWSERRNSTTNPQWNSKARACLPPLQPLSILRPTMDDLGVWPNPPTPGARPRSMTPRGTSSSDREFDCSKDKLAFFDKECSKILDHIYLGSDIIAKNREILRHNKITHVLNCVGFSCPEYFKNELVYRTLWLQDCPSEDIMSILYDVFDYFEDVREKNGRVFVHCCHGVSRSTSLVIAYLMWREGKSFDDAFEFVKKARGVTNPNVGFACQLLQCQKRVHAQPASPNSLLKMYRMGPHSPYDPLHLVPKLLCEPGVDKLDSRGAFIIHVPSNLYVWIGKNCSSVMSETARASALQVIRYEKARSPITAVKEGNETFELWDAFGCKKGLAEQRKQLDEYDLDFEIFRWALAGGVMPPFPVSESGPEMRLPVRENGWNGFGNITTSSKLESTKICFKEVADTLSSLSVANKNIKLHSNSTSPSTSVSPSTSDCSSSFTSSPSSSNWSDLSSVSVQSSPYIPKPQHNNDKHDGSRDEGAHFVTNNKATLAPQEKALSGHSVSRTDDLCSASEGNLLPSLAERRGMKLLPSIDESSQVSEKKYGACHPT